LFYRRLDVGASGDGVSALVVMVGDENSSSKVYCLMTMSGQVYALGVFYPRQQVA
jgi:hypothetical protein